MAKKASKPQNEPTRAASVENASDDFSSSSDDFSDTEDMHMDTSAAATETTGHKVQLQKSVGAEATFTPKTRAVIYIGQLPKQFQEKEMRKYFSQFGELLKVRLARDRRSGASKYHGWVEFVNKDDARIAAETMNNYLMFGKMMQVMVMDHVPADLFPANYREDYKEHDWRQAEFKKQNAPKPLEEWKALQAVFESEKASHLADLKALGFDYSLDVAGNAVAEKTTPKKATKEKASPKVSKVTKPKKAKAKK